MLESPRHFVSSFLMNGPPIENSGAFFSAFCGDAWREESFLAWPPDMFALTAALLQRSGAYIRVVQKWPPLANATAVELTTWAAQMREHGKGWWKHACEVQQKLASKPPAAILERVQIVKDHEHLLLVDLCEKKTGPDHAVYWQAVLELMAIADEACAGAGVTLESRFLKAGDHDHFLHEASLWLGGAGRNHRSATLCRKIPPHFGLVLPKMHTPQSGLTLRSLTHNLAFLRPSEVNVGFFTTLTGVATREPEGGSSQPDHALNLLFVPWPTQIVPKNFSAVQCERQHMADSFSSFTYAPAAWRPFGLAEHLGRLIDEALKHVSRIDGVIMPELALDEEDVGDCIRVIAKKQKNAFLVSGVGSVGSPGKFGTNKAVFATPFLQRDAGGQPFQKVEQSKHHRWQLDRRQIDQYGLGSALDPSKKYWEHIPIEGRTLHFVSISDRVVLAMLICEDLARQDPVGDFIRGVGPNLVVALLMDGPQLSGRWPAHYATVLADDPGSSVLTVTSVGMSELSRPKEYPSPSRVVGLWRDRLQGLREIPLPEGAEALVLTLALVDEIEWSADGRNDDGESTYLTLNGIQPIKKLPPVP